MSGHSSDLFMLENFIDLCYRQHDKKDELRGWQEV